ncbi:hypothetical protein GALL_342640 [mine drainage metagenome]|uniref:Uncharacterized protein n=1 Tax=mine drainage metagenome TaxID=410659 RepID=A0A1J5QVU1_9ZZZZ
MSLSTFRWWETVGWVTSATVAMSHTHASPVGLVAIRDTIRNRSGSARALSTAATWAAAAAPMACAPRSCPHGGSGVRSAGAPGPAVVDAIGRAGEGAEPATSGPPGVA